MTTIAPYTRDLVQKSPSFNCLTVPLTHNYHCLPWWLIAAGIYFLWMVCFCPNSPFYSCSVSRPARGEQKRPSLAGIQRFFLLQRCGIYHFILNYQRWWSNDESNQYLYLYQYLYRARPENFVESMNAWEPLEQKTSTMGSSLKFDFKLKFKFWIKGFNIS